MERPPSVETPTATAIEAVGERLGGEATPVPLGEVAGQPVVALVREESFAAVTLEEVAGRWRATAVATEEVWQGPFELCEVFLPTGVVVAATRNRERWAEARGGVAVAGPLLVTALAGVIEPDIHAWLRPRGVEARLEGSTVWRPVAELPRHLATLDRFIEDHRRADDPWAHGALMTIWDGRDKLPLVRTLIERASPDELDYLGGIGAGPLEDMASEWLLDELGDRIVEDRRWLCALGTIWDCSEDRAFEQRFQRLLTPEMRAWLRAIDLR
jgi:hypothetical protein